MNTIIEKSNGGSAMAKREVLLQKMSWLDVQQAMEAGCDTIMVPIGSVEQHGRHLPVTTDSLVVEWIAEQTALGCEGVLVAPIMYYGVSDNHIDFPGTASLKIDTLKNVVIDVGVTLLGHGFKNLILLNGHGGNNAAIAVAAHDIRQATGKFVGVIMWSSMVHDGNAVMESDISYHADEGETSSVLWISPELVKMDRAVKEIPKPIAHFGFTHEELASNPVDQGLPRTKDVTVSGVIGDATLASKEKGKAQLEDAVKNLIKTISELRS
jgi:creatinine amidohydrolase